LDWLDPQRGLTAPAERSSAVPLDSDPSYRFTLRLTRTQRDHLRARAGAAGMSCARYVLATITACDSDAGMIAGKDAVQALLHSNDLLAQALRTLGTEEARRSVAGVSPAGRGREPGTAMSDVLREHLGHAAAVLSDIELTRAGRAAPVRGRGRANAKAGGNRKDPRNLGQ
jgi:hypothetical protein